jgi:hypothetical protein
LQAPANCAAVTRRLSVTSLILVSGVFPSVGVIQCQQARSSGRVILWTLWIIYTIILPMCAISTTSAFCYSFTPTDLFSSFLSFNSIYDLWISCFFIAAGIPAVRRITEQYLVVFHRNICLIPRFVLQLSRIHDIFPFSGFKIGVQNEQIWAHERCRPCLATVNASR